MTKYIMRAHPIQKHTSVVEAEKQPQPTKLARANQLHFRLYNLYASVLNGSYTQVHQSIAPLVLHSK